MPRLLGKNPGYRKHKATGQAVVTLSGRDFYLGPWQSAASKAEYERRIREWNAAGRTLAIDARNELAIVELLAAFKRHAKTYYLDADGQTTTEYKNYSTLLARLTKAYGRTPVCEFGPLRLKAFRQLLVDQPAADPPAWPLPSRWLTLAGLSARTAATAGGMWRVVFPGFAKSSGAAVEGCGGSDGGGGSPNVYRFG